MCPIRHQDDFQRVEIDDWDEWVDGEIRKGMERGEFDDLPDKGKPIKIWRTEVNPEYDLAFSRLKNAGVMPAWMELDAEISRLTQEMQTFLNASRRFLQEQLERLRERQREEAEPSRPPYPRWQFWRAIAAWWRLDVNDREPPPMFRTISDLVVQRDRMRQQFLDRAAVLDKKIREYHDVLPRELSNLQRLRWLPERAERVFDEEIPARMLVDDTGGET